MKFRTVTTTAPSAWVTWTVSGGGLKEVGSDRSTISFQSLYSNDEFASAADRRIKGCFDVYLADPREISQDSAGPAPPCRGHLRGTFDFFYERGRPAQPFP